MLELALILVSGVVLVKVLERCATRLVARHRPGAVVDVSGAGFEAGDGGC